MMLPIFLGTVALLLSPPASAIIRDAGESDPDKDNYEATGKELNQLPFRTKVLQLRFNAGQISVSMLGNKEEQIIANIRIAQQHELWDEIVHTSKTRQAKGELPDTEWLDRAIERTDKKIQFMKKDGKKYRDLAALYGKKYRDLAALYGRIQLAWN